MDNDSLVVKCGNLSVVARHFQGDVFQAVFCLGDIDKLTFTANRKDEVTKLFARIRGYEMFFARVS